jgi:hypothetical protein
MTVFGVIVAILMAANWEQKYQAILKSRPVE